MSSASQPRGGKGAAAGEAVTPAAGRGAERRLDPRVDLELRVEVTPPVGTGTPLAMRSLNLSVGGALCMAEVPLQLNSLVTCRIHLPGGGDWPKTVRTDAIVLRVDGEPSGGDGEETYCTALYFVDMEPVEQEALRRFVFSHFERGAGNGASDE